MLPIWHLLFFLSSSTICCIPVQRPQLRIRAAEQCWLKWPLAQSLSSCTVARTRRQTVIHSLLLAHAAALGGGVWMFVLNKVLIAYNSACIRLSKCNRPSAVNSNCAFDAIARQKTI